MERLRRAWRILLLAAGLAVVLPLYWLSGPRGHAGWTRRYLRWASYAAGVDVRMEGAPLDRGVLFAANHLSWMDILVLGGATGGAFVAKSEIAGWPVIGWLAKLAGTIFVSRDSRSAAQGQAAAIADTLASGRPVSLFPEGTTSGGAALLPFRASLFAAVAGTDYRVQPVAIDYGAEAAELAWPREESAGRNAIKLLGRPGRRIATLRFADPIEAASLDRKELARRAEAAVDARLAPGYSAAP